MRLKNRVAVITGAGGGQGIEICKMFAKEGANIAGIDINKKALINAMKEVKEIGRDSLLFVEDISNEDTVNAVFKKINNYFGKLDILVNAAGVLGKILYMIDQDEKDWYEVMDTNAKGTFLTNKAAVKHMIENIKLKKQDKGKVVNISSIVGRRGVATCSLYNASKFAVTAITQSLALEVGDYKINVNAVGPGVVETPMNIDEINQASKLTGKKPEKINAEFIAGTPLKRLTTPKDIAYACIYFASDDSDMVTGQTLNVCGGMFVE